MSVFLLKIFSKTNSWYDSFFIVIISMVLNVLFEDIIKNEIIAWLLTIVIIVIAYFKIFYPITYPKKVNNHESDTINE